MTISYVEPVITYVSSGNGAYPFAFKVLAESDIEVWYTSAATGARVQLVRGSDFSVAVSDPGGTVTILDNAPAGGQILIERRVPIDQPTDWVNNGPFDMETLEDCLDRIIMIVQQLGWDVSTGQAAINFRGPWATLAEYTIRDIVRTTNGNYYFCVVRHTSSTFSTDLTDGNWVLLIDFEAIETHATNAAASAADALASRNTAIARSAAAELSEIAAAASAAAAAADADEIRDWPVSTGLATDVAEHLAFSRKNLLINGGFDVWQRGSSIAQGSPVSITSDRWRVVNSWYDSVCPSTASRREVTVGESGGLFAARYVHRLSVQPILAVTIKLSQRIEDLIKFVGKTVTLSFYAKASVSTVVQPYFRYNYDDYPEGYINGEDVTDPNAHEQTIAASWARYSTTVELPAAVSSSLVADRNSLEVILQFLPDTLLYVEIANVQLEFGDTATDFEYRHPAEELMLCQRYYETGSDGIPKIANMLSTDILRANAVPFKVTKRRVPDMTIGVLTPTGYDGTPGAINATYPATDEFCAQWNWIGGTAGRAVSAQFTWAADAEL